MKTEIDRKEKAMLQCSDTDEMIGMLRELNILKSRHRFLCQRLSPPKYNGIDPADIIY